MANRIKRYPMNGPSVQTQERMCWYWVYPQESVKLRREYARKF